MIYRAQLATVTITNTAAEAGCIPAFTLPANLFTVGRQIRTIIAGYYSAAAVAPTIAMRLKAGPAGTTVLGTATSSALLNLATNQGFWAETLSTVRAAGAGGSIISAGKLEYVGALGVAGMAYLVNTAEVALDLTQDQIWTPTVQMSGANVSNTVVVTNAQVVVD